MISEDTSGKSSLRFLNIQTLDVRGTGFQDLNQIETLSIHTLDIRETKVENLKPILQFPFLQTLIVGRNQ